MDKNSIIKNPHMTEKSALLSEKNAYVFEVAARATKSEISKAIQTFYEVVPKKIRIINMPEKTVFVRGRAGKKSGYKKAIVFLNKGEKIEFV